MRPRTRLAAHIREIEAELRALGTPERAAGEKRYLKSDLEFLGVAVPVLRKAAHAWRRHAELATPRLVQLADALWRRRVHELRSFGIEILRPEVDRLKPADLERLEGWLRRANTWAHVDEIAAHLAGPLVERHPELNETLDRWAVDESFWLRRSALLALLPALRRGAGDWRRFTRYADAMLEEKEFFLRKAIGWVLREVSKSRPERVKSFVSRRIGRVSGVTLREAVRHLDAADRDALLAAYRAR